MFKKFLTIAIIAAIALTGCRKDSKVIKPTIDPSDNTSGVSFSDVSASSSDIKYDSTTDKLSVTFQEAEGSASFKLKADRDWTISAVNTRADSWVSIAPNSGSKGETNVKIEAKPNDTYDERSAEFQFVSGSIRKTIRVDQKQKDALIVTDTKVEMDAEGGDFKIEVQHNVKFTVQISPDATWIKPVQTKGLQKESLVFRVEPNEGTSGREGKITIASEGKSETVRVLQHGSDVEIKIGQKECTIDSHEQEVEVLVTSNVGVKYTITSGSAWIKEVVAKSSSTDRYIFVVSENSSYDSREGCIVFSTVDGSVSESFIIKQAAKDAIVVAAKEYKVAADFANLNFTVSANVDFNVDIDVPWIARVETKGLVDYPLSFFIDSNSSTDERIGHITVQSANNLKQVITVTQAGKEKCYLNLASKIEDIYSWEGHEIEVELDSNIPYYDLIVDITPELNGAVGGLFRNGDSLNLILLPSQDDAHEFTVTIKPVAQYENVDPLVFTVRQEANPDFHFLKDLLALCDQSKVTWRPGRPFGEFGGIEIRDGRVVGVDFYHYTSYGLKSIPESIGDLSEVERLDLHGSSITGTIPSSIGKLTKVENMRISETSLVGPVPDVFQNWNSLRVCVIAFNEMLDGPLPKSIGNHPVTDNIQIVNNKFTGTVPEEWMKRDNMRFFDFEYNCLSGKIPPAFFKMNGFEKFIPGLLRQRRGYVFDLSDVDEVTGWYSHLPMVDYKGRSFTIGEIVKKNKFTVQLYWGTWCPFSKALMPLIKEFYEKYHDSGLEIVALAPLEHKDGWTDKQTDDLIKQEIAARGLDGWYNVSIEKSQMGEYPMEVPYAYVYDSKGNVVFSSMKILDSGKERFSRIASTELIPFLEDKFGALDDTPLYESKDFSKDGDVMTLQKATSGKGIDIVFMGDGYVDKDMTQGGVYESMMKMSMEEFFNIEPYKTFRNKFNVYAVKAVSKNNKIGEDYNTALSTYLGAGSFVGGDTEKCYEYALKVPSITSRKNLLVVTLVNSKSSHGTAHTDLEMGSSVAYVTTVDGTAEMIGHMIRHEAGGHGFGFLADEYGGNLQISITARENMQQEAKTFGAWANVDFTSDPKNIKWKKYLEDSRYKSQVSVYEGGATYDFGVWRPTEDSMMNQNMEWFNAPSREAIYKRIMLLSGGTYSWDEFVKYDEINRTATKSSSKPASAKVPYVGHAPVVY